MRRNKQPIRAKEAIKFETKWSEWRTCEDMKEMYTEVYSHLAEVGLAVKRPEPVWRNLDGEIVSG